LAAVKRAFVTILLLGACAFPLAAEPGLPATGALRALGNGFAGVYEKVAPSVVVLEVRRDDANGDEGDFDWRFLFRNPGGSPLPPPRAEESEGSGFIIRPDGYILTNAHVIEGADPETGVTARRQDGTRWPVRIVGVDRQTDLAVLKAEAGDLPAIEWGDSEAARVGEFVCSIGAPFELDYTLTVGVISAKGRSNLTDTTYEDYLQTDAAINPGNSGGPLCNLDGRVIGVNTLINGINRGLGFAIPSRLAKSVSDELIASGRVIRPWLGIRIETLADKPELQKMMGIERGVVVRMIEPDAPAARSALRPADVIVEIDGQPVVSARELQKEVLGKKLGQEVSLKVWRRGLRSGDFRTVAVTTAELPPADRMAMSGRRGGSDRPPGPDGPDGPAGGPLGLGLQDLSDEQRQKMDLAAGGALVAEVDRGGPADVGGVRPGDVITAVGDVPVEDRASFEAAMARLPEGEEAMLLLERGGKKTYAIIRR
jgi:S1-C subfamily serine protease